MKLSQDNRLADVRTAYLALVAEIAALRGSIREREELAGLLDDVVARLAGSIVIEPEGDARDEDFDAIRADEIEGLGAEENLLGTIPTEALAAVFYGPIFTGPAPIGQMVSGPLHGMTVMRIYAVHPDASITEISLHPADPTKPGAA